MATTKQFQVNLRFNADTQQAMNNVNKLSASLQKVANMKVNVDGSPINEAVNAAKQLQTHLSQAMNADTGRLNMNALNTSLRSAGTNLSKLSAQLLGAGQNGRKAFMDMGAVIAQADAQVFHMNTRLQKLMATFANTLRWQIAAAAIQAVTSKIREAIDYTKDLNNSLNEIRIVTGYGEITMEGFAEKAAKAAKALNTTTVEYTKAALIFYQQGLSGEDVMERANTVVKMANVLGESSETISQWMTAIWNNFDDGSKSLEYYADVLAKLGSETASSADEITQGLEKFAAIANTVGLSYEYAASALATVTAETRQSADVVGTAFKTLFARIEDLELGKTLDDGTTLGQYSQALEKVGIDIKKADGSLKDMDDILDELGSKWQGFGRDTQVALAQTVGGIRQYNQMIALMDNWDVMQENLERSKDAEGTLENQQKIFEDSWTAATKRVSQSFNEMYENLLDDKTLIGLIDGFGAVLDTVNEIFETIGGFKTIIPVLVAMFASKLVPAAGKFASSLAGGAASMLGISSANKQTFQYGQSMIDAEGATEIDKARGEVIKQKARFEGNRHRAPSVAADEQRQIDNANAAINQAEADQQSAAEAAKEGVKAKSKLKAEKTKASIAAEKKLGSTDLTTQLEGQRQQEALDSGKVYHSTEIGEEKSLTQRAQRSVVSPDKQTDLRAQRAQELIAQEGLGDTQTMSFGEDDIAKTAQTAGKFEAQKEAYAADAQALDDLIKKRKEYEASLKAKGKMGEDGNVKKQYVNDSKKLAKMQKDEAKVVDGLSKKYKNNSNIQKAASKSSATLSNTLKLESKSAGMAADATNKLADTMTKDYVKATGVAAETATEFTEQNKTMGYTVEQSKNSMANMNTSLGNFGKGAMSVTDSATKLASGALSAYMGVQMLTTAFDENASGSQRITSLLMGLTMILPTVTSLIGLLTNAEKMNSIAKFFNVTAQKAQSRGMFKGLAAWAAHRAEIAKETGTTWANTIAKLANLMANPWTLALAIGIVVAIGIMVASISKHSKSTEENTKSKLANAEASAEQGKKAKEAAVQWQKEADVLNGLISSYYDLAEAGKDVTDIQDDIAEQVPKLIEEYKNLAETLGLVGQYTKDLQALEGAALAGDVETVAQITNDLDAALGVEAVKVMKQGAEGTMYQMTHSVKKKQKSDAKYKNGKFTVDLEDSKNDQALKWMKDMQKSDKYSKLIKAQGRSENTTISLNMESPQEFIKDYELVQDLLDEMAKAGMANTDEYRELNELLEVTTEQYSELKEQVEAINNTQLTAKTAELLSNNTIETGRSIDSYEEYIKLQKALIAEKDKFNMSEEDIIKWMESQESYASFKNTAAKLAYIERQYGDAIAENIKKAVYGVGSDESIANDLTKSLKKSKQEVEELLAKIDYSKYYAPEVIAEVVNRIEKDTKLDNLETHLNNLNVIIDNIDFKNMTPEKWKEIASSTLWGNTIDGVEVLDFHQLLYDKNGNPLGLDNILGYANKVQGQIYAEQKTTAEAAVNSAKEVYNKAQETFEQVFGQGKTLDSDLGSEDQWTQEQKIAYNQLVGANNDLIDQKVRLAETSMTLQSYEEENTKAQQDQIKNLKEELEKYKDIEAILDSVSHEMDKLTNARNKATDGKEYLKTLEEEASLLDLQAAAQAEQLRQAKEYRKLYKDEISKSGSTDKKLDYAEDGRIINFEDVQREYIERLANLDPNSKAFDKLKEEYDQWMEDVENYNDALDTEREMEIAIDETKLEKISKQLEAVDWVVQVKTELSERELSRLERQLENLDNPLLDSVEIMKNLGDQGDVLLRDIDTYSQGIRDTLALAGVETENIEKYIAGDASVLADAGLNEEQLQKIIELTDGVIESYTELNELQTSSMEKLTESFEAWREELEKSAASVESIGEVISNFQSIFETVGKDALGLTTQMQKALSQGVNKAAIGAVAAAKSQMDLTAGSLETASQKLKEAEAVGDADRIRKWQAQVDTLQTQLQEDSANLTSALSDTLSTIYETFSSNISIFVEEFTDAMAGAVSYDELTKQMSQQEEIASRFMTDYEKNYELSKFYRQISSDIEKTDNIKAQKELGEIQSIIEEHQKSGKDMTKEELTMLQKRYELKQAEIALEEAQNAKREVRLTRDSQGNYSYIYTANAEAVNSAEQNYEDKLYAYQQSNAEFIKSFSEQLVSLPKEMADAIAELNPADFADEAAYEAAVQDIIDYYTEKINYVKDMINLTLNDTAELEKMTGNAEDLASAYNETTVSVLTGYQTVEDYLEAFGANAKTLRTNAVKEFSDMRTGVDDACEKAGTTLEGLKNDINTILNGPDGTGQAVSTFTSSMLDAFLGSLYGDGAEEGKEGGIIGSISQLISKMDTTATDGSKNFEDLAGAITGWQDSTKEPLENTKQRVDNIEQAAEDLYEAWNKVKDIKITTNIDGTDKIKELQTAITKLDTQKIVKIDVQVDATNWNDFIEAKNNDKKYTPTKTDPVGNIKFNAQSRLVTTKTGTYVQDSQGDWYSQDSLTFTSGNALNGGQATSTTSALTYQELFSGSKNMTDFGTTEEGKGLYVDSMSRVGVTSDDDSYNYIKVPEGTNKDGNFLDYWTIYNELGKKTGEEKDYLSESSNTRNLYNDLVGNTIVGVSFASNSNDELIFKLKNKITGYDSKNKVMYYINEKDMAQLLTGIKEPDEGSLENQIDINNLPFYFEGTLLDELNTGALTRLQEQLEKRGLGSKYFGSFENGYFPLFPKRASVNPIPKNSSGLTVQSLDTGGYTGSWGPEGRLAMLHQKEIVLNAHDTENLLTTVQIVRSMADKLELSARAAQQGLGAIVHASAIPGEKGSLEQTVTIHAEFPNATNHSEIEEAFRNLANKAAQYAAIRR